MATQVTLNSGSVDSAGSLLLKTNGTTTAVTIDTSQNVGVGVTPSAWKSTSKALQVNTTGGFSSDTAYGTAFSDNVYLNSSAQWIRLTTNYASVYGQTNGVHYWYNATSGSAGTVASLTQAMTLDASGNLGVGTTSPSSRLEIIGTNPKLTINANDTVNGRNATLSLISGTSADPSGTCQIMYGASNSTSSGILTFVEGDGTERARIDSSGNLLVGDTSAVGKIYSYVNSSTLPAIHARQDGTAYIQDWVIAAGATKAYIKVDGGLGNFSANNVNLSDERMKTDISFAGNYLAKICAIPVKTFKYKGQTDDALNLGVIAQDVEAVAPELVDLSGWGAKVDQPEDGVPLKAIYQTDLQYALMKSIQELKAIVDAQAVEIAALKGTA